MHEFYVKTNAESIAFYRVKKLTMVWGNGEDRKKHP
jgi:hypothetical protein